MPRTSLALRTVAGALLLGLLPLAVAHGHDGDAMDMDAMASMSDSSVARPTILSSSSDMANLSTTAYPPNYFAHGEHGGLMLAHIALMTIAWTFVLPVGEYLPK
jgi:hypothetical protein